ncbi:MAG TPA: ion channel [Acetobacteraceae bacterium]|nr:ion channel [Acetobacteraceae bacterium]
MARRPPRPPPRNFSPAGLRAIERRGFRGAGWRDAYHLMMTMPLSGLLALLGGIYLASNLIFALVYLAAGNGIAHARPGSLADAFFFSVQTMATIGYGEMYPRTLAVNWIVTAEAVYGLLTTALSTGIVLNRLSRPSARVMFSRVAIIVPYEGVPTLMLRVANQRRHQIVEARVSLTTTRDEVSAEGVGIRRFHDLHVLRPLSPVFALSWTIMHPITPNSPLHGMTAEQMQARHMEVLCTLIGLEETFSQTVHTRYVYGAEDLRWNRQFADIFIHTPDGRTVIDYSRFHDTIG